MKTKSTLIFAIVAVLMLMQLFVPHDVAAEIVDPGGGSGDNYIGNPGFETGSLSTWTDEGGDGSAIVTSSREYEGSYSLHLKDVKSTWLMVPWPHMHIVSKTLSVPIGSATVIGGAMYVKGNPLYLFTAIGIHITPADIWLVYYVKGGSDEPDWGNRVLEKVGSTKNEWHHFYSNVASDLSSENIDYYGQTIDEIELHVEAISIATDVVDGYFDDLYIGSTPPSLSIDAPNDNQWISGTYRFNGDASDNRGQGYSGTHYMIDPTSLQLLFYPLFWTSTSGTTDWYVDVDTTTYAEGSHKFYAYATDVTGSIVRNDIDFRVDNTDPILDISSPSSNTWVSDSVTISGTASDARSGVSVVKYKIDDGDWISLGTTTSWTFTWDSTSVDDGSHTITVMAVDLAGNVDSDSIILKVDNSGPVIGTPSVAPIYGPDGTTFIISFTSLSDGTGIGVNTVTAYITNPDGTSFELSILFSNNQGGWVGTISMDYNNLEGTYTIDSITAIDFLGNPTTITTDLFFVFDRTNPSITLTSHSNHATLSGSVTLSGEIFDVDSGPDILRVYIDGVLVFTDTSPTSSWSYLLETDLLADGYHVFHFYIIDKAGNSRTIYKFLQISNSAEPVPPFIPVVNEYGTYITSCRIMVGDSQVVIALVIPESASGAQARLMIAEPFLTMWTLNDITYVDGAETISFKGWESNGSHYIQFPLVIGSSPEVDLRGHSIALAMDKTAIDWTVTATDFEIEQFETHQITVTATTNVGVPYGVPLDILVYALQDNEIFLIGVGTLDDSGVATVNILIGNNPELSPGNFSIFVKVSEAFESVYDTTTSASALFSGFAFFEQSNWSFNPVESELVHYTATVYDQRFVVIQVFVTDSTGSLFNMIGQSVQVYITGPDTDYIQMIYQTNHDDGVYALFTYNFTHAGAYALSFDYIPIGYYLDVENHSVTVTLETQRPTSINLSGSTFCSVGTPIVVEATLTDNWASGFPIDGAFVEFYYKVGSTWIPIGTAVTDGFGIARLTWSPTDSIWRTIAGSDLDFNATYLSSEIYKSSTTIYSVSIDTVSTYITLPFIDATSISAGSELSFNIILIDQFGTNFEGIVEVTIHTTSGIFADFTIAIGVNSSFLLTLPYRDNYTITLDYLGNGTYHSCSASDIIDVYGKTTILSIAMDPIGTDIIAEEALLLHFLLEDLQTTLVDGAVIHVILTWNDQETEYELINGIDDTILFAPQVHGILKVTAWYNGDDAYEPAIFSIDIDILRRPVAIDLMDLPDIIYPYVGPSYLTYSITISISDLLDSDTIDDATILLCYIFENETVYQPIWNDTGYINSSLVQEYLAWGLFRIVGSATADENGVVTFDWEVEMTTEQKIKVFALSLQTDLHMTGISSVFEVSYNKIPTTLDVDSHWDGEGKTVSISATLWDSFVNEINGVPVQVYITSYLNPTSIIYKTNVTTGFNSTFEWESPEYGAYNIYAIFHGDEYYVASNEAHSMVVVSWRLIEIDLDAPTVAYPGETIQMTATVTDLNSTDMSLLLESLTVYFVYFLDGELYPIGRGDTDSSNVVNCVWTLPDDLTYYNIFAFTKRQVAYDAGRSDFHRIAIRPFFTYLDIQVNSTFDWHFNFSYSFKVSLTDENGNDLLGEVVDLYLTDNYTEFWGEFNYESSSSQYSLSCDGDEDGGNPHYHLYKLRVIIGFNDTFIWYAPGRVSDRILFAPRAIAIGFYDGSSTHFPTALTRKMSSFLIETDVDLIFDEDPRNVHVGMPQEIRVNVTNEYGEILYNGKVVVTITASNGEIFEYVIDLAFNSSFLWTPTRSDRYTIEAEFQGGELYGRHHCGSKGRWHWRHKHWREILFTRSFNVTGMIVYPERVDVFPNQLLSVYTSQNTILLQASIVSNLGMPIGGTSLTFYYLDSIGGLHLIGTSFTNEHGYVEVHWNLTDVLADVGYEAVNIFVEVDSHLFNRMTWLTENIVKIWPETEPDIVETTMSEYFFESSNITSDPLSPIAVMVLLSMVAMPASIMSRKNRRLMMLLAAVLFIFCTTSMLYTGLGIESHHAPFADDLIFDMRTNPSGPNLQPFSELKSARIQNDGTLSTINPVNSGTISASTPDLDSIQPGFSTGSPNATYIIMPLMNTLDINFTAFGYYVISILDEERNPVDTVAGYASGPVCHSFLISDPDYTPGKQYTVNTFVTTQRFGIIYGDNSWIVMSVSRCSTKMELFLEPEILQYTPDNHTITIAAKLSQLRTNQSIANEEIDLYYRSSLNLEWHDIASMTTDENGIAHFDWDVSLPKDSYVINATFSGDERFDGSMTVDMITIDGASTQLGPAQYQPSKYWVQYSHPIDISAQLISYSGTGLFNKIVNFVLLKGDKEHWIGTNRTDEIGIAKFTYLPYVEAGAYDFRVEFEGDNDYAASSFVFTDGLTILKRNVDVMMLSDEIVGFVGNPIEISARFTDDMGNPIRAENVTLDIYDSISQQWRDLGLCETAPSGLATYEYIIDVSPGSYVYRFILQGTNRTVGVSKQGVLSVLPYSTEIYFIPTNVEFGQNTDIMAHLQDSNGYPLEEKTILYYIEDNSKWVPIGSAVTDENGWARLSWDAKYGEGVYELKTLYPGSSTESSVEFIDDGITISKATSILSMSISRKVQYTLPAQINMTLTDSSGVGLAHRPIALAITAEGLGVVEEVTLYTNQYGFVFYRYIPPYLGSLTVDAVFSGDENYVGDAMTDDMIAEKMELAISLVVNQTYAHRGDILQFSGHASIVVDEDTVLPADEGMSFILTHIDGIPINQAHYSIVTVFNGLIEGSWTIPRYGTTADILQAGDYTFRISTPLNVGVEGETTFDLTIIERTYLTAVAELDGVGIARHHVDQEMDFRFILLDEDLTPMTNTNLVYFIDNEMQLGITDFFGTILHSGFVPDSAGGLYSSVSYAGSKYYDSNFVDLSLNVYRRNISLELFESDDVYYMRNDSIALTFELLDSLIESDLLESIDVEVYVDGSKVGEFTDHNGFDSVESILPDNLQAGPHEISMRVKQSRVYEEISAKASFYAYEDTLLSMYIPETLKSNMENTLRVQLTDEDGTPLKNKYVTLTIFAPNGETKRINLRTDSFGEANYGWTPNDEGEYEFEAWYGGETLFEETDPNSIPYRTEIVQEGGGKVEAGNSPLWLLPLMLLTLVNIALEYLTFGCVGFLMAEGDLNGQTLKIHRISYPSIRIERFNVTIWPFGMVEISVPIPYIHTENSIRIDSDEAKLSYSESPDKGETFDIKAKGLSTDEETANTLDSIFSAMEGNNEHLRPTEESDDNDYVTPIRTEEQTELNINILSPEKGTNYRFTDNVTVVWTVDYPADVSDYGCQVNVDNGTFETPNQDGDPVEIENGAGFRVKYNITYECMDKIQDIGHDNLANGSHRVRIKAHADDVDDMKTTGFYVFNFMPILYAFGALLAAALIGLLFSHFIDKLVKWTAVDNPALPGWLKASIWAFTTVFGSIFLFLILNAVLNFIATIVDPLIWIMPICGISLGVIAAVFCFVIAYRTYKNAAAAAHSGTPYKAKRIKTFNSIYRWGMLFTSLATAIVPGIITLADENGKKPIPDWVEWLIDIVTDVAGGILLAVTVALTIRKQFPSTKTSGLLKGKDVGTAIGEAQKSIAAFAVGLSLLVKVSIDLKHAW